MEKKEATAGENKEKTTLKFKHQKTGKIIEVLIEGNFYEKNGTWYYGGYNDGRHYGHPVKKIELNKGLTRMTNAVIKDAAFSPATDQAEAFELLFAEKSSTLKGASSEISSNSSSQTSSTNSDGPDHSESKDDDDDDSDYAPDNDDESTTDSSGKETVIPQATTQPTISSQAPEKSVANIQTPQPSRLKRWWNGLVNKVYEKRVIIVEGGAIALVIIAGSICCWHFYPDISDAAHYASGWVWNSCMAVKSLIGTILSEVSSSNIDQCPLNRVIDNPTCPLNRTLSAYRE